MFNSFWMLEGSFVNQGLASILRLQRLSIQIAWIFTVYLVTQIKRLYLIQINLHRVQAAPHTNPSVQVNSDNSG